MTDFKYTAMMVLLCGLSACNLTASDDYSHTNSSTQKQQHAETQSPIFNEILQKYPIVGIGETKNVDDIVYKYIHLGMTKTEVKKYLIDTKHYFTLGKHNLYIGYYQNNKLLIPRADINIFFHFNQNDILESIDANIMYHQ